MLSKFLPRLTLKDSLPWLLIATIASIFYWDSTQPYPGIPFLAALTPHLVKTIWAMPSALLVTLGIYARVFRNQLAVFYLCAPALMTMFLYIFNYPSWNVQYDWWQNITTLEYYANNNFIPPEINKVGESHQAPLYYALAGLIYKITFYFTTPDVTATWQVLQAFSFLCFAMFLLYGIFILQRTVTSPLLCMLGIALIMYWPSNIMHAGRISNNILVYLACTGCAYHMMSWFKDNNLKQLNFAFIWIGIALATQTSGIILCASFVTLALYQCCNHLRPLQWPAAVVRRFCLSTPFHSQMKPLVLGIIIIMMGLCVGYGRNFYNFMENDKVSIVFGTHVRGAELVPWFFYTLNLPLYLQHPYILTTAEQHIVNIQFWGYYLRSMSFGQMVWHGKWQAIGINVMLLCGWLFLLMSAVYFYGFKRRSLGWAGYFLVFLFFTVAAQATAKVLIPELSYFWGDARYVYAIIVFFTTSYLVLLQQWQAEVNKAPYWVGLSFLIGYNILSYIHLYLQLEPVIHLHPH